MAPDQDTATKDEKVLFGIQQEYLIILPWSRPRALDPQPQKLAAGRGADRREEGTSL